MELVPRFPLFTLIMLLPGLWLFQQVLPFPLFFAPLVPNKVVSSDEAHVRPVLVDHPFHPGESHRLASTMERMVSAS